ncbi:hypothetical protein HYALB_00003592 [Hymenoscyphus albidus]|uniref:Uncharacterized protein n=1 Tax=Hymenoscyphus albidus TaxID=595503 RepID=A0A9N9M043_9HELO|nr:hypothetical protein HYALB_00003592 [Hymenoscyphus albidus]
MSTDPTPDPKSRDEVARSILLFSLLALATNSMASAPRNVLGFSGGYRFYLASSPIVCLADTISTTIRMLIIRLFPRTSEAKSCALLIQQRLQIPIPTKGGNPTDGRVKILQNAPWPQLIIFVIGTLPAAIKLCSFSGTPWTTVWGMMFLVSFLGNKIIELIASTQSFADDISSLVEAGLPIERAPMPDQYAHSGDIEKQTGFPTEAAFIGLSVMAHSLVISNLITRPHILVTAFKLAFLTEFLICILLGGSNLCVIGRNVIRISHYLFVYCGAFFFNTIGKEDIVMVCLHMLLTILWSALWCGSCMNLIRLFERETSIVKMVLLSSVDEKTRVSTEAQDQHQDETSVSQLSDSSHHTQGSDETDKSLTEYTEQDIGEARLLHYGTYTQRFEGTCQMSIPLPIIATKESTVKIEAVSSLLLFSLNILYCTCWYIYEYNPHGTVNPGWVGVFG